MSKQTAKVKAECLLLNDPLHTLIQGKPFNNSSGQNLKSIKKQTLCKNQKAFPVFDLNFLSLHCPNGNGEMKILLIDMQNSKTVGYGLPEALLLKNIHPANYDEI